MKSLHHLGFAGMLPRTMSQGPDASKDAESAAKADESQTAENRTAEGGSPQMTDEPPIPETEEALNVPKAQTIGMLGAMSTLTLIAWFAARLACNAHPDQVREPKHFSTKDLAADPKNAAFEFHHSFETGDFTTALDLASGEVKNLVENKLIECESKPDACEENRSRLAGTVSSTGRVLEQVEGRSTVELVSYYRKQLEPKTFQFVVEKQGDYYRVLSRKQVANAVPVVTAVAVPSAVAPAGQAASATNVMEQVPVSSEATSDGPSSTSP